MTSGYKRHDAAKRCMNSANEAHSSDHFRVSVFYFFLFHRKVQFISSSFAVSITWFSFFDSGSYMILARVR